MGLSISDELTEKLTLLSSALGKEPEELIDDVLKRELAMYLGNNLDAVPVPCTYTDRSPFRYQMAEKEGKKYIPTPKECLMLEEKTIFGEAKARIICEGRLLTVPKAFIKRNA